MSPAGTPAGRYDGAPRYIVPGPDGSEVTVAGSPRREPSPVRGTHLRRDGERLDHLAGFYLGDPTAFWRLCDANDAVVPEALTDARSVDVPDMSREAGA